MPSLISYLFSSTLLITLALYHLTSTIINHIKSPSTYISQPYHLFTLFSSSSRLKHLQLYLILSSLSVSFIHQLIISYLDDPLLNGHTPVYMFTSLQYSIILLLFVVLTVSLLVSECASLLPLGNEFVFGFAGVVFFLECVVLKGYGSMNVGSLQEEFDLVSSRVAGVLSGFCFVLAVKPRFFIADVGLGGCVFLRGVWGLQSGLSLYVEGFIPEGCHRMLDVVSGVEGSTKCDVDESRLRAFAMLDLIFLVYVLVVVVVVLVVYAIVAKSVGVRRVGLYEALPVLGMGEMKHGSSSNNNHVQMKVLSGLQA